MSAMPDTIPEPSDLFTQRERALSRWDNEGGVRGVFSPHHELPGAI